MKIISSKEKLYSGLEIVAKAVPQKTPNTNLDCILIDATGKYIRLYAKDSEMGIETYIEGSIEEPGMIAINAQTVINAIRLLNSDDIVIESESNMNVKIGYVNRKPIYNITGRAADEFSSMPETEGNPDVEITQYTLKELISKTIFSVSTNENNRILTGELFDIRNGRLRVISMDTHRISIRATEVMTNVSDKKIIIPAKSLSEISKILSGSMEDKVYIFIDGKYAIFVFNNTRVYTTLLHGEFFDVDKMLSKDYNTKVIVNRQNLIKAVQKADIFVSGSDKRPAIFDITSGNMNITLKVQNEGYDEDIEIQKEGDDLRIGFNSKYITDALSRVEDEEVSMYFDGKISPMFIRDDRESYTYLILPINIANER